MSVISPERVRSRPAVRVVGAVVVIAAVVAWAWTLTGLTPAMTRVNEVAPTPGGDTEVFMWVAELRWGAILLAGLGLVTAAVTAPRAPRAGFVLAGALVIADAAFAHNGPDGNLLPALLVGAGAVAASLWVTGVASDLLAGWPRAAEAHVARRLAVVGVVGAACGPILLAQGTPGVNHPFLPATMGATTALTIGLLTALGGMAALAARPARSPQLALAGGLVAALPFATLGLCSTLGVDPDLTVTGAAAAPLAALIAYLAARPRPTRPEEGPAHVRSISLIFAAVVAVAGSAISLMVLAMISAPPAALLFSLGGGDYLADGLSLLPGTAGVALLAATLATRADAPSQTP